ncbi:hypothetical protein ECTOBSL9_0523 [Ectothiorhodospira sp. BSL-9]|nr:hypothetical protein ECTOBSL9_0523 [Ectothiorhodospira sp. BSL-9]
MAALLGSGFVAGGCSRGASGGLAGWDWGAAALLGSGFAGGSCSRGVSGGDVWERPLAANGEAPEDDGASAFAVDGLVSAAFVGWGGWASGLAAFADSGSGLGASLAPGPALSRLGDLILSGASMISRASKLSPASEGLGASEGFGAWVGSAGFFFFRKPNMG